MRFKLWGNMNNPHTLEELKGKIRRERAAISEVKLNVRMQTFSQDVKNVRQYNNIFSTMMTKVVSR